jgi:hypothetical protein
MRWVYTKEDWEAAVQEIFNENLPLSNRYLDQASTRQMFVSFFEGLGMLVKRQLIDITMVEDLFSNRVIWWWETHIAPYIDNVREQLDDPAIADSAEYLYNVLRQRQQSNISV